ncbi:MAG: hypothetical protein O2955_20690 [Planctomycetota bacterium]|nr:hypothetical protein [Planctomycetota bacterium]MDA1214928.1 hypothetical protein [Planctomycetota bacterium]
MPDLICLKYDPDEGLRLSTQLKAMCEGDANAHTTQGSNGDVSYRIIDSGIFIDCHEREKIDIQLSRDECEFLLEAIHEYLDENSEWSMDHSFESLGAKIVPEEIRDVVFEIKQTGLQVPKSD